jgi:hypothetical protein
MAETGNKAEDMGLQWLSMRLCEPPFSVRVLAGGDAAEMDWVYSDALEVLVDLALQELFQLCPTTS